MMNGMMSVAAATESPFATEKSSAIASMKLGAYRCPESALTSVGGGGGGGSSAGPAESAVAAVASILSTFSCSFSSWGSGMVWD